MKLPQAATDTLSLWRQRLSRGDNTPQQDHNPAEAEELSNNSSELSINSSEKKAAPQHRSHCRDQTLSSKTVLQQGQGGTTRAEDTSSSGQASPRARRLNCGPGTQRFLQPNFSLSRPESLIWLTRTRVVPQRPLEKTNGTPVQQRHRKRRRRRRQQADSNRPTSITNITAGALYAFTRVERR